MKKPLLAALAAAIAPALVAASVANAQEPGSDFRPLHGLDLPASFTGTLPCADCPGIEMQIDLWPDQSFHQRWTYLDRDVTVSDMGRWRPDPATGALRLRGQDDSVQFYAPQGTDRLQMRDLQGLPITSDLNYGLSAHGFDPVTLTLPIRGEVTYLADAAMITECVSGRSYPMAMEAAFPELQRVYLDNRAAPGAPLLMTLEAEIAPRPPMEGDGTPMTVIPLSVIGAFPDGACARERATARLTDTWWQVERIADMALAPDPQVIAPHVVLDSETGQYRASVGCNQMLGGFEAGEGTLTLLPGPTTLMACPPPLDTWEMALVAAFAATRQYRMVGDTLVLSDAGGADLAVLRAVYLQ